LDANILFKFKAVFILSHYGSTRTVLNLNLMLSLNSN